LLQGLRILISSHLGGKDGSIPNELISSGHITFMRDVVSRLIAPASQCAPRCKIALLTALLAHYIAYLRRLSQCCDTILRIIQKNILEKKSLTEPGNLVYQFGGPCKIMPQLIVADTVKLVQPALIQNSAELSCLPQLTSARVYTPFSYIGP
jgi:hypothetical protein